jgi:LysM repeat protein
VSALELGEIQVQSSLGQPLRASVTFALQPNEQIHDYCIYLKPGTSANGLPGVSNAAITVGNGAIGIAGRTAIAEPLLSLQLTVDCPHSAHLQRDYSVFIDLDAPAQLQAVVPAATSGRADLPVRAATRERATAAARPTARAPIASSGTYRVQPGDSLSGIASRISGRSVGIWQAVDAIFATNADAFMNKDKNLLRAGAVLAIPDSILSPQGTGAVQSAAVVSQPAAGRTPVSGQTSLSVSNSRDAGSASESDAVTTAAAPTVTDSSAAATAPEESASVPAAAASQPGDMVLESDNPFVSPIGADAVVVDSSGFAAPSEVIPPTVVENAASTRSTPVSRGNPAAASDASWLIWLGGSGVALIVALLLFGRRLKERFMPSYGAAAAPGRRRTDASNIEDANVASALTLPSLGTVPVARVVSLDADLEDGSGVQYGDMDVAQEFGFSDSGEFGNGLDLDLTSAAPDRSSDAMVPRRFAEPSILVSETPPQHDDTGEYDLSMIVDATQQILDESDGTTKDLRAIEVSAGDDNTVSEEYAVIKDVDYKILEQDYEAEFTATQVLDAELSRAARALSRQYGKDEMGDTLAETTVDETMDDETSLLPSAEYGMSGDDETTALPVAGKAERAADDTSHLAISSNMTLDDDTANEQIALDVPAADNDATIEVDIESATIDTRKMRAS